MKNPRDCWATPEHIVRQLEADLGADFFLDVCAYKWSAKAPNYFTPAQDGLASPWSGRVWCNPPYSEIAPWVDKACCEFARDAGPEAIYMLLPVRTDQKWFHKAMAYGASVCFFRGRIQFVPPPGIKASSNREPSMLIYWDKLGNIARSLPAKIVA